MTKPKKIKITGLSQSPEGAASRLQELKSNALRLLRDTDYTQFPDSGLSLRCMIEYQVWRFKVRRLLLCEDKGVIEAILVDLENTKPAVAHSQSPLHVYTPTILFDDSSLASAKTSAMRIIRDYKRVMGKRYDEAEGYRKLSDCDDLQKILNYIDMEAINGH
jgi:hypothetical protein